MPRSEVHLLALKKRSEFLAVSAKRTRWVAPGFIIQVAPRPSFLSDPSQGKIETTSVIGFGLTASKKMVGIAVRRNRARRRLRALAQEMLPLHARAGYNFVFIARAEVLTRDYQDMRHDVMRALKRFDLWLDEG